MNKTMNTKGVEDGIGDEQVALEIACPTCSEEAGDWCLYQDFETDSPAVSPTPHEERVKSARSRLSPAPTFSYQLAMCLTRNGADAPHMQAKINMFLYDGKWQTTQGAK